MECITIVSYSLLVNGEPKGKISPLGVEGRAIPSCLIYFYFVRKG